MTDTKDPIALFAAVQQQQEDALKMEAKFQRLTRKVFTSEAGEDWLRLALARVNFMGSVFSAEDGMNPANAAYRDGMRSVFSDILNSSAASGPVEPMDD